jgi:uncharacterized membrane protein
MNESRNPYSPPRTPVVDPEESGETTDGRFIPYGRTVSAGRGVAWIGDAWRILRAQPGMWAALLLLVFVAYVVASMIPLLNLFTSLLTPFVTAAIALAADEQRRTGTFDLKVMTRGFEKQPASLLAVGGVAILAGIVFLIILAIFLGSDIIAAMAGGRDPDPSAFLSTKFLLAFLIGLALVLPIGFATYLAPQLILLHGQPAMTAMKMSLAGLFKNLVPGIVFGLVAFFMMLVSMIPLFLGLLITLPILAITNYTIYRDIFIEDNS